MVAGVFGQAVLFDPRGGAARRVDAVGENVVDALAGELSRCRSAGVRFGRGEGVIQIEISGIEQSLNDATGNSIAIFNPLPTGVGLTAKGVDPLAGCIGVEVAEQEVGLLFIAMGRKQIEDDLQFPFTHHLILLQRVRMKVEDAEGPFMTGRIDHHGFKQSAGQPSLQRGMIDRRANGEAAQERDGVTGGGGLNPVHLQPAGDALKNDVVVGLDQGDDIGPLGFDHLGQGIGSSFAAVENVVADDSHGFYRTHRMIRPAQTTQSIRSTPFACLRGRGSASHQQSISFFWNAGLPIVALYPAGVTTSAYGTLSNPHDTEDVQQEATEMSHARIGELLGQMVKLSGHDVEEILQEQSVTRWRFGDIALSWGLCRPEHIWRAWCQQIGDNAPRVNMSEIGVDAQATAYLPRSLALQYQVVPLRMIGDDLVLAAADEAIGTALRAVPSLTRMKLKFVVADADEVREAIERYYPALHAAG